MRPKWRICVRLVLSVLGWGEANIRRYAGVWHGNTKFTIKLRDSYRFVWPIISGEITGLPHTAVEGTTIEAYGRRSMRKLHGTKQKLCSGNKWILLLT